MTISDRSTSSTAANGDLQPADEGGSRIASNTAWATVGELGRVINQALLVLILARTLGPAVFGRFDAATTLFQTLGPLVWFGAPTLIVQRRAQRGTSLGVAFSTSVTTVVGCGLAASLVALALVQPSLLNALSLPQVAVLALAELVCAGVVECAAAVGLAQERLNFTAAIRWLTGGMRLLALLLLMHSSRGAGETRWDVTYAVASLLAAVAGVCLVRRTAHERLAVTAPTVADLRFGASYSLTSTAFMVQDGIDKPLVLRLAGATAAGTYAAGYRAVVVALIPLRALLMSTYSRFFKVGLGGLGATRGLARHLIGRCLAYGVAAGVALYFLAPLVASLYGAGFGDTDQVVRLLAPLPALRALSGVYGDALTGAGQNGTRMRLMLISAGLNVVVNFILIPRWSWHGAAIATLVSETFLAVTVLAVVLRRSRSTATAFDATPSSSHGMTGN